MPRIYLDMGIIPWLVAKLDNNDFKGKFKELIEEIKSNLNDAHFVMSAPELDSVELPENLSREEVVIAIEPRGYSKIFPPEIQQLDSEYDRIGSFCPLRGRDLLRNFIDQLSGYEGVLLDLTHFYAFESETGTFSCACEECMEEYEKELEIVIEDHKDELKEADLFELFDPKRVLECVEAGALKSIVKSRDESSFSTYKLKDLRQLLRIAEGESHELAASFLFLKARSRVCARAIADTLESFEGLRAVAVDNRESVVGCSAAAFLQARSIDEVWVEYLIDACNLGKKVRYYNLEGGRRIVSDFDYILYSIIRPLKMNIKLPKRFLMKKIMQIREIEQILEIAVASNFIPNTLFLKENKGNYVFFGYPSRILYFIRNFIKFIINESGKLYLKEDSAESEIGNEKRIHNYYH
jgi:hypothetical protein